MNKIIKRIIAISVFLLSMYFIKNIYTLNILPSNYFYILTIGLIILNLLGAFNFLSKGFLKKVIGFNLYLILVVFSILGIKYSSDTINFLNDSFNYLTEYNDYSLIVLKDSKYKSVKSLNNKRLAYIENDKNINKALTKVEKYIKTDNKKYENINDTYQSLVNVDVDCILVNSSFLDVLKEYLKNIDNLKVLKSYKIKSENSKSDTLKNLEPVNIYISGSDTRGELSNNSRSDVNMILSLNPNTHKILLTNIPRDYYVQLHSTTGLRDKLTHAGIYGIDMSKNTLEDLLDIKISSSVKVGFKSVIKLVDLLGGVDVYSNQDFITHAGDGGAKKTHIVVGNNHLNGAEALSFVRERYAYSSGDLHRGENQQVLIEAIIKKLSTDKSYLLRYNELLTSLASLYQTDISDEFIKKLVKSQLSDMSGWTVEKQTLTGTNSFQQTYSMPRQRLFVLIPDNTSINNAKEKINEIAPNK